MHAHDDNGYNSNNNNKGRGVEEEREKESGWRQCARVCVRACVRARDEDGRLGMKWGGEKGGCVFSFASLSFVAWVGGRKRHLCTQHPEQSVQKKKRVKGEGWNDEADEDTEKQLQQGTGKYESMNGGLCVVGRGGKSGRGGARRERVNKDCSPLTLAHRHTGTPALAWTGRDRKGQEGKGREGRNGWEETKGKRSYRNRGDRRD